MAKIDEQDIILRLKNPSTRRRAFEVMVNAYSRRLYWHIHHILQNHDDTDDVLQNTFLKAWSNVESFRGDSKLSSWLYKIAINESITFINREKQRQNISIDDDESFIINSLESDDWFDGDELQKELQKAIATLPEKQRMIFNMKYFDDMKYEDISEILGTSVGALKASYHHAVKKIENFFTKN